MRHIPGTISGFFSGWLISMIAGILIIDMRNPQTYSPFTSLSFFLLGWMLSHYLTVRGTHGFSKPMARAFLIGSGLWLAMVGAGLIFSAKAVVSTGAQSGADQTGTLIGGGLAAFAMGGFSIFMAFSCFIGFVIFFFVSRTGKSVMSDDVATKSCPDCAELVNAAAIKCKHCGASLSPAMAGTAPKAV